MMACPHSESVRTAACDLRCSLCMEAEIERLRGEIESWKALVRDYEANIERLIELSPQGVQNVADNARYNGRIEERERCAQVCDALADVSSIDSRAQDFRIAAAAIRKGE
jgi:hypothetical protein